MQAQSHAPDFPNFDYSVCCIVLGLVLVAICLAAHPAMADSYAYSMQKVDALRFSQGSASEEDSASENDARFQGFKEDYHKDEADAPQAKSGPGPFPAENDFSAQGKVGEYARADSIFTSFNPFRGTSGANVAEDFSASGAFAFSVGMDTYQFTLLLDDPNKPLTITLLCHGPLMNTSTTKAGEVSEAQIQFSVDLFIGNSTAVLDWTPNGTTNDYKATQGTVSNVIDPYSLNTSIRCAKVGCSKTYAKPVARFSLTYTNPKAEAYIVRVRWREDADVNFKSTTPEPPTLLLLAPEVLGLAMLVRKRLVGRK